jgi:colanic acid biosynthesis glycosyl transferase WcaI
MHALMIAQYFPPDVAGTSTRAYNAAKAMKLKGCQITVVTAFPHYPYGNIPRKYKRKIIEQEEIDGIRVIRTWVPRLAHASNIKRLRIHTSFILSALLALLFVRKVDIIFAMNPSFFSFFPAMVFKLILRKNIILNIDDMWPEVWYELGYVKLSLIRRILDYLAKSAYRISVAITPLSYGYVEILTEKYKVPKEKITVIEHGVDTSKFRLIHAKPPIKGKEKKKIVYSGALAIGYDFEPAIKAAKLLEKENVFFIIRGIGDYANKLQQMVVDYNLKNVEVRTNPMTHDELIEFLNDADIFLLPMNFAGFDYGLPTKTLEYQAIGKPIVCISKGEAARYIKKTESGLVTSTRDPQDLAGLIMRLVRDQDLAKSLGSNGFKYIMNNLTLEMVGKRFMDVISKSIN